MLETPRPPWLDLARLAPARGLCLAGLLLALAGSAGAQSVLSASPDVTLALGAGDVVATDESVAIDDQLGVVVLQDLGPLPESADVIGYHELAGSRLMAFDTTVGLPGGVVARPGDVVTWNGSTYALYFSAASAGIPSGVRTDAVSRSASGLLLSFDTDVDLLGGVTAADEDLVYWDGLSFTLAFDGSTEGVDPALELDAAEDLGGGSFLMSFDTAGSVGGVVFDDEDVLRYAGGSWSLEFDASAVDPDWGAADLDAVMLPEPGSLAMLCAGVLGLSALARRRSVSR